MNSTNKLLATRTGLAVAQIAGVRTHMKRTAQKLSLLCLTAGLFTVAASAQTPVTIDNPGFELPNTTKISAGWDVSGNDVPGWMDVGPGNGDSGIEGPGSHFNTGNCGAYARGGDPGAYQITTNTMSWGKKYTLTWYGSESWNNSVERTSLIRAGATNDTFASCTELAVASPAVPQDGSWNQYTVVYIAGNADVGKYIGIGFRNTGPSGGSWCNWDDFGLTVEDASPAELLPTITAQPVSQSVYQDFPTTATVVFTAAATGPDLSYQWKAGAPGSGIYTNVPNATNNTLSVLNAQASADYVLSVTNSASSVTSDLATLTVVPATYVNGLYNGDFELPALGKISSGFDVLGSDVPGWRNAGTNQNDTGMEGSGSGNNSSFAAYLHRGQDGAYQISPTALQLGDTVTLTWDARDSWQGVLAKVSILSASSQDAAFGSTVILAATTNEVTGWWGQNVLTFTVGAGDVGKLVGVAFQSADPATATGWANFDNFAITVTPPAAAPVILTQPFSQTAWLGGTVTLNVIASGSSLNYQWQAGVVGSGIYTNISNGGQFSGATTASLTVSNVVVENGLDYVVTVSNTGGPVTSTPATLTVNTDAPIITTQPVALARFTTETATFTVATTGGVIYQWKAGAVGSGVYTNLSNGGQFSGVNAATLTITNLQKANQADYVVEVSNGAGPVTSDPATLTITTVIYVQNFETTNTVTTSLGWAADSQNGNSSLGNNPSAGGRCIFDSNSQTNQPQAFYTSAGFNNAFPVIKLTDVPSLTLYVDLQSWWHPESIHTYFAVQMNWGQWYVSTTELPQPTGTQTTLPMAFDPTASTWNQLTVSGTGGPNSASMPLVGAGATANLTGYMTGAGVVTVHSNGDNNAGSSWVSIDNFKIAGDGFVVYPGLSMTTSGGNVVLTWGYGTLVESTSVTGPWTPSGGTSPKIVSPTGGSLFYRLQLP